MASAHGAHGDRWRFECPNCRSTRWVARKSWYYCESCYERSDGLFDKKRGEVV